MAQLPKHKFLAFVFSGDDISTLKAKEVQSTIDENLDRITEILSSETLATPEDNATWEIKSHSLSLVGTFLVVSILFERHHT
jgi:hypothetical protein